MTHTNFHGALAAALRSDEYASLAGEPYNEDGSSALDELEAELVQALTDLRAIRTHTHDWDERGFCVVCGSDGNA